jgi:hypothetical protein
MLRTTILLFVLFLGMTAAAGQSSHRREWEHPPKRATSQDAIQDYLDKISANATFTRLSLDGLQLLCVSGMIESGKPQPESLIHEALVYVSRGKTWRLALRHSKKWDGLYFQFEIVDKNLLITSIGSEISISVGHANVGAYNRDQLMRLSSKS